MFVRVKRVKKLSTKHYRVTLDVIDPERHEWDYGDCQVQIDLWDEPSHHARPRGILKSALEIYRLSPEEQPASGEASLLWGIGEAVHHYVDRVFQAGILCPFAPPAKEDAAERSE